MWPVRVSRVTRSSGMWWVRLVLVLPVVLPVVLVLLPLAAGCPKVCSCKWKAGKEWVECAERGLKGLPQGAREETQVLDLSGNQLLSLATDCFFMLRLVNLQRLYLARSRIQRVATRAFTGLQGLVELDLSDNNLEEVPAETFASVGNLMRLNLAGNPLKQLQRDALQHLAQLSFLDLSRCRLGSLEPGLFSGLHALEWLRLNDNLLESVPESTLPLTTSLHGLPLHGNPWLCDCRLSVLRDWLRISQTQAPQESEPSCAEPPRLKGRKVRPLKVQELACLPRVTLPERLEVYEGDNATLHCQVEAFPRPLTMWLFNGEPFDREAKAPTEDRIRYSFSEQSSEGKISVSMEILNVEVGDEGSYVCQAENAAGMSWGNLSIHVVRRERSTVEPPSESAGAGYAAAIAAGALFGTLLALGCLFLGIFLYARRLRSSTKKDAKPPPPSNSNSTNIVPPSILKKNTDSSSGSKNENAPIGCLYSSSNEGLAASCLENAAEFNEFAEEVYLQNQHVPQLSCIEPDLINQVPPEGSYFGTSEAYSNCLDHDGYPLNFGLPKLGPPLTRPRSGIACETLPRIRQRQQVLLNGSAALPATRLSREAEFLARAAVSGYPTHPLLEISFANIVPTPFIPSPPAGYRSEPAALSPHSFLPNKKQVEAAGVLGAFGRMPAPPPLHNEPSEDHEIHEHPESPDEGYVGDAMDV